jgi:hypothetical protein
VGLVSSSGLTAGAAAIRLRDNGSLRYASDVTLVPGIDGNGLATMPQVWAIALVATAIAEPSVRATQHLSKLLARRQVRRSSAG